MSRVHGLDRLGNRDPDRIQPALRLEGPPSSEDGLGQRPAADTGTIESEQFGKLVIRP